MPAPRVLTFNFHEPYLCLMARAGLPLVVGEFDEGRFHRPWQTKFRAVPPNVTFLPEAQWRADLAAKRFDVVIAQNEDNALDIAKEASASWTPALCVLHNRRQYIESMFPSADPIHRQRYGQVMEVLQRVFTLVYISESKRRSYRLPGIVIPPGLDASEYGGYRGERAEVLRVGNVMRARNVMFDVDFQERILDGLPNVLLGEDPAVPAARPSASFDDLLEHYRALRCYLHVTRDAYEDGYNLAMLEAMACGMPVVSLANMSSPLTDGYDGFVSHDAGVLRRRIESLLGDGELAAAIGAKGRDTVTQRFPLDRFTVAWRAAIENAAETSPFSAGVDAQRLAPHVVVDYVAGPVTTARYMERALRKTSRVVSAGYRCPEALLTEWGFPPRPPAYLPQEIDLPLGAPYEDLVRRLPNDFSPNLYLWIDSGAKAIASGLDRLACLKACYLIDTHIAPEIRLAIARHFDHVFLAQKGQVALFRDHGVQNVHWLPLACSPELHGIEGVERTLDVAWVGRVADDHDAVRRDTVAALADRFPKGYYGQAWPEDMARLYGRAKIVVNMPIANDVNMRVFEAMAAGALLISPEAEGMADLFRPGEHFVAYASPAEIPDLVRRYLEDDAARARIAGAGRAEVWAKHTYDMRMRSMLETIFGGGEGRYAEEGYYRHERPEIQVHIPPGTRKLLDVGCGAGAFGRAMKRAGIREVVGIEVVEQACRLAKGHLDQALLGSVETMDLPFPDDYFDVITCNDVLEHLAQPQVALERLKRVLRPGGVFVISIPNIRFAPVLDMLARGRWKYDDEGIMDRTHLRFFTGTDFRILLEEAGLEVRTVQPLSMADESFVTRSEDGSVAIGRVIVKDVTPEEVIEFRTYQWLGVAAKADDSTLDRAQEALDHRRNEEAYGLAKAAPESLRRNLILAKAAARIGRHGEAETLYRTALAQAPGDANIAAELGILLVALNQTAQAERHLAAAVAVDAPNDRAVAALALIHVSREEWEPAFERFRQSIELNMQCESVVPHLIAVAEIIGRREEIADLLLRYARFFPGRLHVIVPIARMFLAIGRNEDAREIIGNALVLAPGHGELVALAAELP